MSPRSDSFLRNYQIQESGIVNTRALLINSRKKSNKPSFKDSYKSSFIRGKSGDRVDKILSMSLHSNLMISLNHDLHEGRKRELRQEKRILREDIDKKSSIFESFRGSSGQSK